MTGETGPCVGNIPAIPRLGFEGLCLQDGPLAIRQADYASAFPAALTVAASWDKDLAHKRGYDMGMEFKQKGANVILGPVAGPLGRSGYGGRNWEGFSPDPYLTGVLFEEVSLGRDSWGYSLCSLLRPRVSLESKRRVSRLVPNVRPLSGCRCCDLSTDRMVQITLATSKRLSEIRARPQAARRSKQYHQT